jgi:hypothetical protein
MFVCLRYERLHVVVGYVEVVDVGDSLSVQPCVVVEQIGVGFLASVVTFLELYTFKRHLRTHVSDGTVGTTLRFEVISTVLRRRDFISLSQILEDTSL